MTVSDELSYTAFPYESRSFEQGSGTNGKKRPNFANKVNEAS